MEGNTESGREGMVIQVKSKELNVKDNIRRRRERKSIEI